MTDIVFCTFPYATERCFFIPFKRKQGPDGRPSMEMKITCLGNPNHLRMRGRVKEVCTAYLSRGKYIVKSIFFLFNKLIIIFI